jgi:hypothetical protein
MKLVLSVLCLLSCPLYALCELSSLTPLVGLWQTQTKTSVVSERWHKVSGKSFEGLGNRHDLTGVLKDSEELRLVQMQGTVFYIAKVKHNPLPVAFALISCKNNRFRFENKDHDFPKQLDYQLLSADSMQVDVSDGAGLGFRLNFNRQKG